MLHPNLALSFTRQWQLLAIALVLCLTPLARAEQLSAVATAHFSKALTQRKTPYVISISGDASSGKSYISEQLQRAFGSGQSIVLTQDDWFKYDRKARKQNGATGLNPNDTKMSLLEKNLGLLRKGQTISKPFYDHSDGKIYLNHERVSPTRVIIVEGHHNVQNADLKIYVDTTRRVKTHWRTQRDVVKRGHSEEAVLKTIKSTVKDFKRFVEPQREHADVVVSIDFSKRVAEGYRVSLKERNLQDKPQSRERTSSRDAQGSQRVERRSNGSATTSIDGTVQGHSATEFATLLIARRVRADISRIIKASTGRQTWPSDKGFRTQRTALSPRMASSRARARVKLPAARSIMRAR